MSDEPNSKQTIRDRVLELAALTSDPSKKIGPAQKNLIRVALCQSCHVEGTKVDDVLIAATDRCTKGTLPWAEYATILTTTLDYVRAGNWLALAEGILPTTTPEPAPAPETKRPLPPPSPPVPKPQPPSETGPWAIPAITLWPEPDLGPVPHDPMASFTAAVALTLEPLVRHVASEQAAELLQLLEPALRETHQLATQVSARLDALDKLIKILLK